MTRLTPAMVLVVIAVGFVSLTYLLYLHVAAVKETLSLLCDFLADWWAEGATA